MRLIVENPFSVPLIKEPITVGVPCPKGMVRPGLKVVGKSDGQCFPVQVTPLTFWPDRSVKWLLCDFLFDCAPHQRKSISFEEGPNQKHRGIITYSRYGDTLTVNTEEALFELDTSSFLPFRKISVDKSISANYSQPSKIFLRRNKNGPKLLPVIKNIDIESIGPIRLTVRANGSFDTCRDLLFQARVHFYAGTAKVALDLTVHNPRAAKHPGGIWDLGDPASCFFSTLDIMLPLPDEKKLLRQYKMTLDGEWRDCTEHSICIYQESSGGEQWNSPNHKNYLGQVPIRVRGCQVFVDNQSVCQLARCEPIFWGGTTNGLSVVVPHFWQEFPKALTINRDTVSVSLFPDNFPDRFELQGGEQKTHTVFLDFSCKKNMTPWGAARLHVVVDPKSINDSGVLNDIVCGEMPENRYAEFLRMALEREGNFFEKREIIDEYGWRNFGDLYADHEATRHNGDTLFISHYNNQYDPAYSFYREFFRTGDVRWAELASDLARHVIDIDINHTDQDREEYCHGLFWHTDHYLDAGTATHRTFSKDHFQFKDPKFCGAGPGAEHCYTSGLMYHYLFTGDPRFREAVIQLAKWSLRSATGPRTLLAACLRSAKKIKIWKKQRSTGEPWPRYPLTRMTGNCINACLDAYELTGSSFYLSSAVRLIRGTVHPADNVEQRDLLNAETRWSYTVFLASLIKFLLKKIELEQHDDDYCYARDSLLRYASWMAGHEYPFLKKKEILEYPNETWAAQDLRKALIFFHSAKFTTGEQRNMFVERCQFFLDTSFDELEKWKTRHCTRPMALVLQNGWVESALNHETQQAVRGTIRQNDWGMSPFSPSLRLLVKYVIDDFYTVLPHVRPKREWAWLKARITI